MTTIAYRAIRLCELNDALLRGFQRRQSIRRILERIDGVWTPVERPTVEDWTDADRRRKLGDFRRALTTGGFAGGAFAAERLIGFVIVEGRRFGTRSQYLDVSSLHVSEEYRGQGVGRALFRMSVRYAEGAGARRLFLSASPAEETQAFYRAMGCADATERSAYHAEHAPEDRQMEYALCRAKEDEPCGR